MSIIWVGIEETKIIWYYRIAGKFDGELNLVVGVETAKLKSANIILYTTRNDILHTLYSALGPIRRPSMRAVHVASRHWHAASFISCKFANSRLHSSTSCERRQRSLINRPEMPPPILNSATTFYGQFGAKPTNLKTANISGYTAYIYGGEKPVVAVNQTGLGYQCSLPLSQTTTSPHDPLCVLLIECFSHTHRSHSELCSSQKKNNTSLPGEMLLHFYNRFRVTQVMSIHWPLWPFLLGDTHHSYYDSHYHCCHDNSNHSPSNSSNHAVPSVSCKWEIDMIC